MPLGAAARAGAVARARQPAAHAAHRQPARERAHRVRASSPSAGRASTLADVVEDARALIEALLRQRGQPLEVDSRKICRRCEGDGTRLTQVFVNLIANASKFAPEGTPIRVGAAARDGSVVRPGSRTKARAARRRRGIDLRALPARRRDRSPSRADWGWACGSSRSIVERHGGTITAERTAPKAAPASASRCPRRRST